MGHSFLCLHCQNTIPFHFLFSYLEQLQLHCSKFQKDLVIFPNHKAMEQLSQNELYSTS
jgi:hypothetical protein